MTENNNLEELLKYIDPASLEYQEWVTVGMALKADGYDVETWKQWSESDSDRYDDATCDAKWASFNRNEVTGGTIYHMAEERGYTPEPKLNVVLTGADKWRKTISFGDPVPEAPAFTEPVNWNPTKDLVKYLELLFEPWDIIGYTMTSSVNAKGKYVPLGEGSYTNNVGQLIDMLNDGEPIEKVFGTYDPNAGAWIRINPLDGKGIKDRNVVSWNNMLIECDNMSIEDQIDKLEQIQIPIKALVYSGGKSVHAIVPVNAISEREYRFKFNFVKNILHDAGMDIDSANINPSRLSRLPGVMRNGHKQFLIKTEIGMKSFEDWEQFIRSKNDGLPDIINLRDIWDNMPPLKPELIEGVLRKSHKMIIASTSKAGKTFILMELAMAIAEGMNWIGHRCKKGKVLYINMELDKDSFGNRFKDIYRKMGMDFGNHVENIDIWNLRGADKTISELAPFVINRMRDQGYLAVMIDPLYKVLEGDENSNGDVARVVAKFDKIAEETGAAVIYAHHFAKGSSASKSIIDRAAGAGTFARDPDAILTMTQLDWAPENNEEIEKGITAWRIESTLREFKAIQPVDLFFEWPIHKVDCDGRLSDCDLLSSENNKRSQFVLRDQRNDTIDMVSQCEVLTDDDGKPCFKFSELKFNYQELGDNTARSTICKRLKEAGFEPTKMGGKQGFWRKKQEE